MEKEVKETYFGKVYLNKDGGCFVCNLCKHRDKSSGSSVCRYCRKHLKENEYFK